MKNTDYSDLNIVYDNPDFREGTAFNMDGYDFNDVTIADRYIRRSLVGTKRAASKVIHENIETILSMETIPGITLMLAKLFAENEVDPSAYKQLLYNIGVAPNIDIAKGICCNFFLSVDGNGILCR
jgi:hypothetical protein